MNARVLVVAALTSLACTRSTSTPPAPAPDAASLLEKCTREEHEGATMWSCGDAFLVMDAPLPTPITDEAIAGNLSGFEAELVGEGTQKAKVLSRESTTTSTRLRLELPEKGRFFAMMVIVREPKPRAISCSAKETDAARCEQIVASLAKS